MFSWVDGCNNVNIGKATAREHAGASVDTGKEDDEWIFGDVDFVGLFGIGDDIKSFDNAEAVFIYFVV